MIERILVPLDGSELSESALPCALALARGHRAETFLVQVVEHMAEMAPGLAPELVPELQQKVLSRARNYLENRAAAFAPGPVSTLTRLGSPREELPALARHHRCDLLVMASHGRDGAEHWLLGSVAEGVLRQAPCPVLLVRPPAPAASIFRHILVPVDGSEASLAVIPRLSDFLAPGGKVTLLQSGGVSLYPNFAHKQQAVLAYLGEVEARLRQVQIEGLPLEVVVLDGNPVDDILAWSRANACDLIAMSSHGRSGFRRLWLGSVSEKVARHADCDVLIFPHAASG
ncbi:MAG: universal stress protein [Candidatus Eremiobacteraeota bacterium]|nr:universal stress protein [Candidatus Eremiobacteraeota bacterium]MCW5872830.1 universal stress protein [Candidatus Eremiobacteraeota bacterium]